MQPLNWAEVVNKQYKNSNNVENINSPLTLFNSSYFFTLNPFRFEWNSVIRMQITQFDEFYAEFMQITVIQETISDAKDLDWRCGWERGGVGKEKQTNGNKSK